jgi:Cu(I)/Ag(I) efflux system protein CusF
MKTHSILLGAILMAAITPAFAQATSGTQGMTANQDVQGMKMGQNGSNMKMMMDCMPMHQGMKKMNKNMPMGKNMSCTNQTAQGTGVVEAVDPAKGTVTIKHQAIVSIHWPAMTMTFKADTPSLLKAVPIGEKVNFTMHPAGKDSTVTAITPVN